MTDSTQNIQEILGNEKATIYFIGIGGIAMSAAANLAKQAGFEVLGSDSKELYSPAKDVLDQNDIEHFVGYDANRINNQTADLFVVSAGETLENPEVKSVIDLKLPRVGLAEFLYNLSRENLRIVVAGTHGKSTTTGFLGHMLKNLDDSSFMAGAVLQNYQSNFYSGNGHYFVFEGDEYKEAFDDPTPKFHYYHADILVLTNLDFDHPDMYENFEAMLEEFRLLIQNMPEDGLIVYNGDDLNLVKLINESNVASVSFGIEADVDFKAENLGFGEYTSFEVQNRFSKNLTSQIVKLGESYKIQLPGKMNVYNALATIATLRALGFQPEEISLDLLGFTGIKRRFEILGSKNGFIVIDDYAHHPTAVKETLGAARLKYPKAKIWAIFEPHTFSRTKATLPELSKSFEAADEVLISEIYPAREKISTNTINSAEVAEALKPHHPNVRLVKNKSDALNIIKSEVQAGDVVIVMAVGSFNRLGYEIIGKD